MIKRFLSLLAPFFSRLGAWVGSRPRSRFHYLTTDIVFTAVIVVCAVLTVLMLLYQADAEIRQQSNINLSIARRDAAYITRDTGQLLSDVNSKLKALLNAPVLARNNPAWREVLLNVQRHSPYLRSLSLVDPQGKVLVSTTPENVGHVLDMSHYLSAPQTPEGLLRIGPTYAGLDLADGALRAASNKATPEEGFIPVAHSQGDESLVAVVDLDYLIHRAVSVLETPDTRVALLRADGLRLFDTAPGNAGLLMMERNITEIWQHGNPGETREMEAIDGQYWVVSHRAHPLIPIGIVLVADRDKLLADVHLRIRQNSLTIILLALAGMVCATLGYLFFRHAGQHEREQRSQAEARWNLLESTLNACTTSIVITKPNGSIEWVNPAFSALTGYSATEAIGHNPGELCKSGLQTGSFYAQIWQTILDGRVWRGELINRRKDASLYDELLTISPALDGNGKIQHFVATKEDFTEYKATREQLEIAHSHLNAVVENFPGALVMEDTSGRIVLLNQYVFELLGLPGTNAYVLGKPIYPLMVFSSEVAENSGSFIERVEELRTAARPFYNEEIRFKDGRWVERDFIPIRLHDTLIGFLYLYRDISQRKRHARELWQLATSDPLTGIPNRRTFFEHIEHERTRLSRYAGEAALLMMDIDHFKRINDTYGHAAGDAVLCHIVRQIRKLLRESDILARLGGEEFAVLLPQASREGALGLAERIRKTIEETPLLYNDTLIITTTSVGVTVITAADHNTDHALSRADNALYDAKHAGRNQVKLN
jgi:diguanylate cyclase (GGDEF)-like protein/PAS domain S-box-containing protein